MIGPYAALAWLAELRAVFQLRFESLECSSCTETAAAPPAVTRVSASLGELLIPFSLSLCIAATLERSKTSNVKTRISTGGWPHFSSESFSLQRLRCSACGHSGLKRLFTVPVIHCADAWALVVEHADGWSLCFSGDTRPCQALEQAARGRTLLIHEATFEPERWRQVNEQ